ncbi:MAG: DUF5722 domain-containing protein, partial [Armatimonadota bacterium]|nr:DUF5722 domain-containing protein [Armatimonadota bacterium]
LSEANSVSVEGLPHSEGWSSFAIDLRPVLAKIGGNLRSLRLDFGNEAGKTIRIRALQLRPTTEQEQQLAARRAALREQEKLLEVHLGEYLRHAYPCRVTHVAVDDKQIQVMGEIDGEQGELFLAEVPLHAHVTELKQFPFVLPIRADAQGQFSLTLERQRQEGDNTYDRLLSRWAVVKKAGDGYELMSHARYPDIVRPQWDLPAEKPRNKKGLGGVSLGRPLSDLDDLGLGAVTVNIVLNGLMQTAPGSGRTPVEYAGGTWYVDDAYVSRFDNLLRETAKRRIIVSAIVLIGQAKGSSAGSFSHLLAHPDADPSGIFAMPNVSSEEGLEAYAAALDFLARRYSQPDNTYGRIHHWIMHNEVNAGWVWTNAGDKTALLYMDLYHKSMRTAHLIARQYNPHAQVFISLEHHWMKPNARIYGGRDLLDLLLDFSRAEGDFDWAVAFHPYPQNLMVPRVWEDNQPDFTFDTPKITFKNLEVLNAWMKQPRTFYLGQRPRIVHLTEQGLNSPDYSEKSLNEQAAGMAYAWNKMKPLDTIEVFDYHNWVDNRGEGGLRIGLRKFPDDKDDPLGKKPIWFVYQALGTEKEEDATAFARPIIGIQNWLEVQYRGAIK